MMQEIALLGARGNGSRNGVLDSAPEEALEGQAAAASAAHDERQRGASAPSAQ